MLFDSLWVFGVTLIIMLSIANTWFVMWMAEHKPALYAELKKPKPLFFLTHFMHITHPYINKLLTGTLFNDLAAQGSIRKLAVLIAIMLILFELAWIGAVLSLVLVRT